MLTPAHLPELERLLVEHAEAASVRVGSLPLEANIEAQRRYQRAEDALIAFTRAAQSAPPAPVDGEIKRLVDGFVHGAIHRGTCEYAIADRALRSAHVDRVPPVHKCDCWAKSHGSSLLAAIAAKRDARIADLERHAAFFRSLANVRDDGAVDELAAKVDADLAARAAKWERLADEAAAASVQDGAALRDARERIAALEAALREACDALRDWMPSSDAAADLAVRLYAIADADEQAARERLASMGIDADAEFQRFRAALGGFPVDADGWPDPDARCACGHILGFHAVDPPHACGATGCGCAARALADGAQ